MMLLMVFKIFKKLKSRTTIIILFLIIIIVFLLSTHLQGAANSQKKYFSGLSIPDTFSTTLLSHPGDNIPVLGCIFNCGFANIKIRNEVPMTVDDFTKSLQEIFGDRFVLDVESSAEITGYKYVTPKWYQYCSAAENLFIGPDSDEFTYKRGEECPFSQNVWQVAAGWYFVNSSSVVENVFSPISECKTLLGRLISSNVNATKEIGSLEYLEAEFSCSVADLEYYVSLDKRDAKSCGTNNLCIEQ